MSEVVFAVGPTLGEPVALSPLHPLIHGGFRIHCELDDDVIVKARVEIGFVHRSAEKLLEVRDYRAGAMLANRHIWTAPTAGEYAFVLAAEELLGLPISARADHLRLVYAEIDRILSHLAFLAPVFSPEGISPVRERLADLMAKVTGSRMHHQVIRIGGVAFDFEKSHRADLDLYLTQVEREVQAFRSTAHLQAFTGIAVVAPSVIDSYGITGPIARASGVARDQRTNGYGAYRQLVPSVRSEGDSRARILVMLDEIEQSIALIHAAMDSPVDGDLLARTPKNLRLPEGQSDQRVEGPLGVEGVRLFSDGGLAPSRARLRTPSLAALNALEQVLLGVPTSVLALVLASWPALAGDADR